MIGTNGDGKSTVATPDRRSRKKKNLNWLADGQLPSLSTLCA